MEYKKVIIVGLALYSLWKFSQYYRDQQLSRKIKIALFRLARRLSATVRQKVKDELEKGKQKMEKDIQKYPPILELPQNMSFEEIIEIIKVRMKKSNEKIETKQLTGCIYSTQQSIKKLWIQLFSESMFTNPLHCDIFEGAMQCEAEVIQMVGKLFKASESFGVMTSGGTESIITAMYAYRKQFYDKQWIKVRPNIVAAESAHAAFNKAAILLGMNIIRVPIDKNTRVMTLEKLKQYVNWRTAVIVVSCPNFPYGTVDQISRIGQWAKQKGISLHVDCCMGGFIAPFLRDAGKFDENFDFSNPGVTSISCDVHKYGLTPKGTSVLLTRTKELRHYVYFVDVEFPGGIYGAIGLPGSRPGFLNVMAWGTLLQVGYQGYIENALKIQEAVLKTSEAIKTIPELKLMGNPKLSIVSMGSDVLNIYQVCDVLSTKGWHLAALQNPPAIHMNFTLENADKADQLINDLKLSVQEVKQNPSTKGNSCYVYGSKVQMPDPNLITEYLQMWFDHYLSVKEGQGQNKLTDEVEKEKKQE